jgi:hypothetical protein
LGFLGQTLENARLAIPRQRLSRPTWPAPMKVWHMPLHTKNGLKMRIFERSRCATQSPTPKGKFSIDFFIQSEK